MAHERIRVAHVRVSPSTVPSRPGDGKIEITVATSDPNGSEVRYGADVWNQPTIHAIPAEALESFVISAYLTPSDEERDSRVWGFNYGYRQPYSVGLERAEGMVRVLKRVQRALDAAYENDGHYATFGAFAWRILRSLGVTALLNDDASAMPLTTNGGCIIGRIDAATWRYVQDARKERGYDIAS